ncbi:glycosyltransferase [Candidatus Saccharibacteria bacterium]|nr:glycosyltransferase [Candidatus Saccharibacteria bacterium]
MGENKNDLVILHVCDVDYNQCSGVSSVVPNYFVYQNKYATVGIFNCSSVRVEKLKDEKNVFYYDDYRRISMLPEPFDKPDLIVFHEVYKPKYLLLCHELKNKNIPYIIIPHGCLTKLAQSHKRIKKIIGNKLFFEHFIKNAACIQYLSKNEYNNSAFIYKKYYIQGNGVNDIPGKNEYLANSRKSNSFNFVYVGRFDYYIKGFDILFDACSEISDFMKNNNINIKLFGYGDEKLLKRKIAYYNLWEIVKVYGPVFGEKKKNTLTKNDVFVQLSRTEGQPLGVMEAIALGMPVLVSNGTGLKNIVEKYRIGVVVDSDRFIISSMMLDMFLNKNELNQYSRNAYDYAKKNYDWDVISKEAIKNYFDIITHNTSMVGDKK